MTDATPEAAEALATALEIQQQCDNDGVMCAVSRQAATEAAATLRALSEKVEMLKEALEYLINYCGECNLIRTADVHADDCTCTRCMVDAFLATTTKE